MAGNRIRITGARITPIAFADPPLLNTVGVHQPFALRAIIQLDTDAGLVGLGETYADTAHLERLTAATDAIVGQDVFALNTIRSLISDRLGGDQGAGTQGSGLAGMITSSSTVDRVFSPFEVACLDVQGHAAGRPVSDLLGGAVRDAVPFSAYLFYKWAAHPGGEPDDWGAALDPDAIVAQARRIIDEYGFTAIKLKGGVFPPEEEMAAIEALRAAFPDHPLRLDPNAAWTPQTSIKVASGLAGVVEYLEDPTPDLDGMAEVARQAPMPLATNMCVVAFNQLAPAIAKQSVARGAFRPPLLGRSAAIAIAGRHLRQLRSRPVDALQLAPRDQPRRHGAFGGGDAEPHVRVRHPLAVEDRGGRQAGRHRVRRRVGARADDSGAGRADRRGATSAHCTSNICAVASAIATTPATCAASTRPTRRSARAGSPFAG